ncbi:MAG: penicillin acylase family protein [Chitinophagaceae bacterium]|nr:penicillin acylase family protein [Chitinophagaceae bacterium]
MRIVPFLLSVTVTTVLIIVLSIPLANIPPLGKFLSPQHGFWVNADPVNKDFNEDLNFAQLKNKVEVYLDDRLVPHVFAQNDQDAYFVQGYLHAKFRLWQMEFQTQAAAGRLSEILGNGSNDAILNNDRLMRRLGMVSSAEKAVSEIEKNPVTKAMADAYTAGVNAYIGQLAISNLPIEYKLLNYQPEKWNNLKTGLLLKYMSYDLTGNENDFEYTNAKAVFSKADFGKLYPIRQDSLDPVIPRGTYFDFPAVMPLTPSTADSLYFQWRESADIVDQKPDKDNGSNNWAVDGKKTKSGRPILCDDMHLGLSLPSIWYEMHISTPRFNVYGVTLPGAPMIIVGFNDHCSWGLTNAARDVKDYYEIQFKDDTKQEYLYNGKWERSELRIEQIKLKGGDVMRDTVAYTVFGPVIYDKSFSGSNRVKNGKYYAVRWTAHNPSNDFLFFYQLNAAKTYEEYENSLVHFSNPGQNVVFASKTGDIAIWQQGNFPAKWERQGDFVMPGTDTSYLWQGMIPQKENPHIRNPERGFVSSANQIPVDSTYPYYIGGSYDVYRGLIINRNLRQMNGITPEDMQRLQTDNYNVFAELALPVLLKNVDESQLNAEEKKYLSIVRQWNLRNDPGEKGPVIFINWFDSLESQVWGDELAGIKGVFENPDDATLIEGLMKDSVFKFVDNINTPVTETLKDVVTAAFKKAVPIFVRVDRDDALSWGRYKDTRVRHLLRLPALSRSHVNNGGGIHIINATKQFHGPSWRMIVHLTDEAEAYGVYPGGQSGNPGSKYYDNFIDTWSQGKYNTLWFMKKDQAGDKRIISRLSFSR